MFILRNALTKDRSCQQITQGPRAAQRLRVGPNNADNDVEMFQKGVQEGPNSSPHTAAVRCLRL